MKPVTHLLNMFLTQRLYFLLDDGTIGRAIPFEPREIEVDDLVYTL
jgi:hypothetical protein